MDIEHNNPNDLRLSPVLERAIGMLDIWNTGVVDTLSLIQQDFIDDTDYLIQFDEPDILKYFTSNKPFRMSIHIGKHTYKISSMLYTLLESKYHLDLHYRSYKISHEI